MKTANYNKQNGRPPNMRFGKIAALASKKRRCEFGSYYPAGKLVKPLPLQAAGTLAAMWGQCDNDSE